MNIDWIEFQTVVFRKKKSSVKVIFDFLFFTPVSV